MIDSKVDQIFNIRIFNQTQYVFNHKNGLFLKNLFLVLLDLKSISEIFFFKKKRYKQNPNFCSPEILIIMT